MGHGPGLKYDTETHRYQLNEIVVEKCIQYCRYICFPSECLNYLESDPAWRSRCHSDICWYLDLDDILVKQAMEDSYRFYKNPEDIGKVIDLFINLLTYMATRPEKLRHPSRISEQVLDEVFKSNIGCVPDTTRST